MPEAKAEGSNRSSARAALEKRAENPITPKEAEDLFSSKSVMYDAIDKAIKEGRLFDCGRIKVNRRGSPSMLIATWKVPKNDKHHEYGLTLWLKQQGLLDYPILRGSHVDPETRSDGTLLGDPLIDLEFDTGQETWTQVRSQFKKYRGCEQFVLVIARSKRRTHGIQSSLADLDLDDTLLFTHKGSDRMWDMFGQEEPLEELWNDSGISPAKKPPQGDVAEQVTEETVNPKE